MKFRILFLLVLICMILVLFTGCAQPNDPETADDDPVYLELQAVYPTDGYVSDLQVTDGYVYVAEDEAGFSIWDNATDVLITRYTEDISINFRLIAVDEASNGLLVYNRYGTHAGILLYNIADKSNPVEKWWHSGNSNGITVLNVTSIDSTQFRFHWLNQETLYYTGRFVSAGGGAFWNFVGESSGDFANDVADFNEDYETGSIYCASYQLGLQVVEKDIEGNIITFPPIGSVGTIGQTIAVKVVDNIAYLGNREEGIQVFDIADINNPVELFNYDTTGLASDIVVNTELNVFALASTSGGIYLFNGPQGEIRRLQRIDDSEIGYTYKVKIHGNYLYAGTRYGIYKYKIVNL
ncbi:MAG: hypothetical protein K9M99_01615 [Candidatus Cloacimonetes bacterium]|nr:hypothetical protein [Candidatus Cloacimonadota bacterium]